MVNFELILRQKFFFRGIWDLPIWFSVQKPQVKNELIRRRFFETKAKANAWMILVRVSVTPDVGIYRIVTFELH